MFTSYASALPSSSYGATYNKDDYGPYIVAFVEDGEEYWRHLAYGVDARVLAQKLSQSPGVSCVVIAKTINTARATVEWQSPDPDKTQVVVQSPEDY